MIVYLRLYKRFLQMCRSCWKYGLWAAVITLLIALLQLPMPFLTKYAIDTVFPQKSVALLNIIVVGLVSLGLINALANYLSGLLLFIYRNKILLGIQAKLLEHIEYLSMSVHSNNRVGYMFSRLGSDTSHLQGLMADTLISFTRSILTFIVGICALFFLHWKLALLSICVLPFFAYSVAIFSRRIRRGSHELQEKNAQVNNVFFEILYSIPMIKAFCLEKNQTDKAVDKLNDSFKTNLRFTKTSLLFGTLTSFVGSLGPLLILYFGGREIMSGHLTLGSFVAFNSFIGYLYGPIQTLMGLNTTVQTSFVSLKRVFEIFDMPREDADIVKFTELKKVKGGIRFENVTFSYNGSGAAANDVSFAISPGEKVALVGKSGAGKTTLINLLLKFYRPERGKIFLDNENINQIHFHDLRSKIGVVQQNPLILAGSVGQNIRLGNLAATDDEVISAAKTANLYDFIVSLPNGFDTEVGERGMKLSGGERQRLAIAQVVLKNSPILIFDEATSEIDSESERLIQDAMKKIIDNKTTIFIAHRLFSIREADKIIFIENGMVEGIGGHEQLYETVPMYRQLYDNQFKGFPQI